MAGHEPLPLVCSELCFKGKYRRGSLQDLYKNLRPRIVRGLFSSAFLRKSTSLYHHIVVDDGSAA